MPFNSSSQVLVKWVKYLYIVYLLIRDYLDYRRIIGDTRMSLRDRIHRTYPHNGRLARFFLAKVISDTMISLQTNFFLNLTLLKFLWSRDHIRQVWMDYLLIILKMMIGITSMNDSIHLSLWRRALNGGILSSLGVLLLMIALVYDNYLYLRYVGIRSMVNGYVNFWGWHRWILNYAFMFLICLAFLIGNADSTGYVTFRSSNSYYGQLFRRMNNGSYGLNDLYFMDNDDPVYSIDKSRILNNIDYPSSVKLLKSDNLTVIYNMTRNRLGSFWNDINCLSHGLTNPNWLYCQSLIKDGNPKLIYPPFAYLRYAWWVFRDDRSDSIHYIINNWNELIGIENKWSGSLINFLLGDNTDTDEWSDIAQGYRDNNSDIILGILLILRDILIKILDEWRICSGQDNLTKVAFVISNKEKIIPLAKRLFNPFLMKDLDNLLDFDPNIPMIEDSLPRVEQFMDYMDELLTLIEVPIGRWEEGNERIIRSVSYNILSAFVNPGKEHDLMMMSHGNNFNNPARYLRRVMGEVRIRGYGLDYPLNWSVSDPEGTSLESFQAMYHYPLQVLRRSMVMRENRNILLFENAETNGNLGRLYTDLMDVAALSHRLQVKRYGLRLTEVLNDRMLEFRERISVERPRYELVLKEPKNNIRGKLTYVGTNESGRIFCIPDVNNTNYLHLERTFALVTLHIESFYPKELAEEYVKILTDYFVDIFMNSSRKEIRFGSDYEEELWFVSMINDRELLDDLLSLLGTLRDDYLSKHGMLREKDLNEWWTFLSGRKAYQESIHHINASLLMDGREANTLHYNSLVPPVANSTYSWWYTYNRFALLYRLYKGGNPVYESGDKNLHDKNCIVESLPRFKGKGSIIRDKSLPILNPTKSNSIPAVNPIDEWFTVKDKAELYDGIRLSFENIKTDRKVCSVLNRGLLPELSFPYLVFYQYTKDKECLDSNTPVGIPLGFNLSDVNRFVSRYGLKGIKKGFMQDMTRGLNTDLSFFESDLDCLGDLRTDFINTLNDKDNFTLNSYVYKNDDGKMSFKLECRDKTCRQFILLCLGLLWAKKYGSRINTMKNRLVPSGISPLNVDLMEYDEEIVSWSHHKFYVEFFARKKRIPMELMRSDDRYEGIGREPEESNKDLYMFRRYFSTDDKFKDLREVSPLRIHYNYWCNYDFHSQTKRIDLRNINIIKSIPRQVISPILENDQNYQIFKDRKMIEIYFKSQYDPERISLKFLERILTYRNGRESELIESSWYGRPVQVNPYDTTLDYYLNKLRFYKSLHRISINLTHMVLGIFDRSANFDFDSPEMDIDLLVAEAYSEIWPNIMTTMITRLSMMNSVYNQMINPTVRKVWDITVPSWFNTCPVSILRKVQGDDEGIDYPLLADSIIEHALFHLNADRIRIRRIGPESDSIIPKGSERTYFVDNSMEGIFNSYVVRSQHIMLEITPDRVGETLLLGIKDIFPVPSKEIVNDPEFWNNLLRDARVPALVRPNWYKDDDSVRDRLETIERELIKVLRECLTLDHDGSVIVDLKNDTVVGIDGNARDLDGVNFQELRSNFIDITRDKHDEQYVIEKGRSADIDSKVSDFEFTSTYLILGGMKDWEEHYLKMRDKVSLLPITMVRSFESRDYNDFNDTTEDGKR